MTVTQITALELKRRLEEVPGLVLLDVREPSEFRFARINNSMLIPLNQIPHRIGELDPNKEIIVICHHGIRSRHAAHYLARAGFENVANLTGGIDAWSIHCDSSVPRY
ncbi:MAG: rhodanese-like domain-containing protein [Gammaproteobacteria bacterium]